MNSVEPLLGALDGVHTALLPCASRPRVGRPASVKARTAQRAGGDHPSENILAEEFLSFYLGKRKKSDFDDTLPKIKLMRSTAQRAVDHSHRNVMAPTYDVPRLSVPLSRDLLLRDRASDPLY